MKDHQMNVSDNLFLSFLCGIYTIPFYQSVSLSLFRICFEEILKNYKSFNYQRF